MNTQPRWDPVPISVTLRKGLNTVIRTAGSSLQVSSAAALGGYIINPKNAYDQRLSRPNVLYVDPTGRAAAQETATTVALVPGQRYDLPPQSEFGVWVNSNFSGHSFWVIQIFPLEPPSPPYVKGNFPPKEPTGLKHPIRSYLYQEYSDDDDLQAFVRAQNSLQQDIIDTFRNLQLPIYTRDPISGALLDWVGRGVYGMPRPSLSYQFPKILGPYNTYEYNAQQYNEYHYEYPDNPVNTNDDLYRRVLTWHYSKGDGKYFNVEWLKKRVMRFLIGVNGTHPNIDQTYQISVTFGSGCSATIRLILVNRTIVDGAIYNQNGFKYNAMQYNQLNTTSVNYPQLPYMTEFADAIREGILELPFMFDWTEVVIG